MRYGPLVILAAPCLLVACQEPSVTAGTAVSPQLETGITSQNGGGQRALGDIPNVSLGGTQGATMTRAPAGKGAAR